MKSRNISDLNKNVNMTYNYKYNVNCRFLQDKIKNIQYFFGKEKLFHKLKSNITELKCEPFY